MRPLAIIKVQTQFENVGDAWIYRELIRLVGQRAEAVADLSQCPPHFIRSLALGTYSEATSVVGRWKALRRMLSARWHGRPTYMFLAPGAHFGEWGLRRVAMAWLQTIPLIFLWAIGVRLCQVGISYEHLGPRRARLRAFRSRWMHGHLVRDEESAEHARSLGIRVHGVMPDLALAADTRVGPRATPTTIAVSFRVDQQAEHRQLVLTQMMELTRSLQASKHVVRWRLVCQVSRDAPGLRALEASLRAVGAEAEMLDVAQDLSAAQDAYAGCSHVLGNRLHALILGASVGAVPLAWIDPMANIKVARILGELGRQAQVLDLSDPSSPEVFAQIIRQDDLPPLDFAPARARLGAIFDDLLGAPALS